MQQGSLPSRGRIPHPALILFPSAGWFGLGIVPHKPKPQ